MIITAMSDIHGTLIPIDKTDLLLICGDFSPLHIQCNINSMISWMYDIFIPYLMNLDAEKIIFIAGNHDFICAPTYIEHDSLINFRRDVLEEALDKYPNKDKVEYLEQTMTTYKGLKIYGCPYVEGCRTWAFSNGWNKYNDILPCDILMTHQPPYIGGLGVVKYSYFEKELGSIALADKIREVQPRLVFCGHIHSGNHHPVTLNFKNKSTTLYNVSIKDEDYVVNYPITRVEI